MGTTDQRLNVTRNRIIGKDDLGERGLDYLRGLVLEGIEKTFLKDVVFGDTALDLQADGNDKFKVVGTAIATDGIGHMLDVANSGFDLGIQFENESPVDYDVGLRFAEVPAGVQVNPRNGLPEYVAFEEQIGESADPDSVVDNGNSTITFVVDSVAEVLITNAGRKVRVFKKIPAKSATTEVIAVEEITVAFVGAVGFEKNQITTTGALGQATISTVASDYTVVLMGPTVRRGPDLENASGIAFLGRVTGGGAGSPPSGFNTGGQDLFDFSFADLADFTRREPLSDRLKIDVKSNGADVLTDQIRVQDPAAAAVFRVDGEGSMFVTAVFSDLIPKSAFSLDLGSVAERWNKLWVDDIDAAGDILPDSAAAHFIGSDTDKWFDVFAQRIALGPSSTTVVTPGDPDQFNTIFKIRDLGLSDGGTAVDWIIETPGSYDSPPGFKTGLSIRLEGKSASNVSVSLRPAELELRISGNGDVTLAEVLALTSGQAAGTADVATMSTLHLLQKSVISVTGDRHGLLVDTVPAAGVAGTAFAIKTGLGLVELGGNLTVGPDGFISAPDVGDLISARSLNTPAGDAVEALRIEIVGAAGAAVNSWRGIRTSLSTAATSGTYPLVIGHEVILAASGAGETITSQVGLRVVGGASDASATVTEFRGIEILTPATTGTITAAYGMFVEDITGAGLNFAIKTNSGIVEFGDLVQPDAADIDLGAVAAANRWGEVFCKQVHADDVPAGVMYNATAYLNTEDDFTASYAPVVFKTFPILNGGVTQGLNRFTVPNAGVYRVSYTIPIGDEGSQTSNPSVVQGKCVIDGGGTPVDIPQSFSQAAVTGADTRNALATSFLVTLAANDTIEVQVQQRSVDDGVPAQFANVKNRDANQIAHPSFSIEAVSITD